MLSERMNGLDLFSGIGGNTLALGDYIKTVAYCEREPYAQAVLLSRMDKGIIESAPIWDDVNTLKGSMLETSIEIITAGFPCQEISSGGNGKGLEGKRSGLFFELLRLVQEIGPNFVFLENVKTIRTRGLSEVLNAFSILGYDCRWTGVSALEISSPHYRPRWFMLARKMANTQNERLEAYRLPLGKETRQPVSRSSDRDDRAAHMAKDKFKNQPRLDRMAYGVPYRVDRIKCLGNAVVPDQARFAFKKLLNLI